MKKYPTIDLSVDYDFFCRELLLWDFGHNSSPDREHLYKQVLWQIRYATLDLYQECDQKTHCDFPPENLIAELLMSGLHLGRFRKSRRLGLADNHALAFDFFASQEPPDLLLNIDAHHDCFGRDQLYTEGFSVLNSDVPALASESARAQQSALHCGNWLAKLYDQWSETSFVQCYPKWKDPEIDGAPSRPVRMCRFPELAELIDHHLLRHVFICRSPEWVPPHLDSGFFAMMKTFTDMTIQRPSDDLFLERMPVRCAPSREDARIAAEKMAQLRQMRDSPDVAMTARLEIDSFIGQSMKAVEQ